MLFDDRDEAVIRGLIGGVFGVAFYLLLAWLTQPGWLFSARLHFDFTFYYGNLLPYALGGAVSGGLWFLFGAEVGVATLPFADEGGNLLPRSILHFFLMMLTVSLWAFLNFCNLGYPAEEFFRYELLYFLVPVVLVYLLIWLGRWVGWYAEAGQIREKLGLTAGPSPLKWRETLPHMGFALLLCLVVPTVLRLCDAPDVPVLSGLLYPYLLLPIGGICSGYSLGKRQGFCPLYPLACAAFVALFALAAKLYSNMADGDLLLVALGFSLAGNGIGALVHLWRQKRERARKDL